VRWAQVVAPIAVGLLILALWQALVAAGVAEYLLPSPASIVAELAEFAPAIAAAALVTGTNAVVGLLGGTIVAVLLAAAASRSRAVDGMSAPVVAALAVVPIVALAPVLNSMYGSDSQFGRQVIAGLAAFVPVFVNTLRGLRQSRPVHRDLMRAYAASGAQTFRMVTLPVATPYLFTGIRIAGSLAVISALVAEYFGGPRGGLGTFIATSAATSAYARAWAYVAAGILVGLAFYLITLGLERIVQRRIPVT
jgi:NitT/TauT family transport system permease protein